MEPADDDPASAGRRTRPSRRRGNAAAAAGATLAALWIGGHLAANSDGSRALLRDRARRVLSARLPGVEVGEAQVDWLFRARLDGMAIRAGRPGERPLVAVRDVRVRPRLLSLLEGRVEPGMVTLDGVTVDASGGLSSLEQLWRGPLGAKSPAGGDATASSVPSLRIRDLRVILPRRGGGAPLSAAPLGVDLDVVRSPGSTIVRGRLRLPGGGHLAGGALLEQDRSSLELEGRVSFPGDIPAEIAGLLPMRLGPGAVHVEASARGGARLRSGTGTLRFTAGNVHVAGRGVGPERVGPVVGSADLRFSWTDGGRRVDVEEGRVVLGDEHQVPLTGTARLTTSPSPILRFEIRADAVRWDGLLAALPVPLRPPPGVPTLTGTIGGFLRASGSPGKPGWTLEADLDLAGLRPAAGAGGLDGTFTWRTPQGKDGPPSREIVVGPGNPSFVPLRDLPSHVSRAVTASEDGGFFGHRGFDVREMAIALSARGGGRLRGASTITQQLAKNLYLAGDRTFTRKAREALATIALEVSLPKARLLEIYLNVAEWGPDVHGVGEAARFWFRKDARTLTLRESAFLASVIPSPRRFHSRLQRSGITPWWQARIDDILGKMRAQGQIDDAQLAEALGQSLVPLGRGRGPDGALPEPPAGDEPADDDEPAADPDPPADDGAAADGEAVRHLSR